MGKFVVMMISFDSSSDGLKRECLRVLTNDDFQWADKEATEEEDEK